MGVQVTVLGSGSRGNATVVSSCRTRILVDAGFSCRETLRRMQAAGEEPERLDAILISHEHADHVTGLAVLARKLRVPVYMTEATREAWRRWARNSDGEAPELEKSETFEAGRRFTVGDITVDSFTIPHDAADPVGFCFRADGIQVGVLTDLGYLPGNVRQHLKGCDLLMVESNHDLEMLRVGPYP